MELFSNLNHKYSNRLFVSIGLVVLIYISVIASSTASHHVKIVEIEPESVRSFKIEVIPSFDHPVVLHYRYLGTLWSDLKDKTTHLTIYEGRGGFDWGEIIKSEVKILEKNQAEELIQKLSSLDLDVMFWSYDKMVIDGTTVRISIKRNGTICQYSFHGFSANSSKSSIELKSFIVEAFNIFDLDIEGPLKGI